MMTQSHFRAALVAAAAIMVGSVPAAGQVVAAGDEVVTLEFVRVLTPAHSLRGSATAQYRPGEPGPDLPPAVTAGARVIGSVAWHDQTRTALAVTDEPAAARQRVERALLAAGYTHRPPSSHVQRGFRQAPGSQPDEGLCGPDGAHMSLQTQAAAAGGSYVVMSRVPMTEGACMEREHRPEPGPPSYLQALPRLALPEGVRVEGGGGGSASNHEASTEARAVTALTPAELFAHFAPQLREQGWEPAGDAVSSAGGVSVWRRPEADGAVRSGIVTVVRLSSGEVLLHLKVLSYLVAVR